MAILVRAGFQTREFEERFLTLGLPYRVIGGLRFYERQEIRDALAYLRLVHQPADDLAFERIINVPKRGIGTSTLQTLHTLARARELPLTDAVQILIGTDELKPASRRALSGFITDLNRWRGLLDNTAHPDLAAQILDESGYTGMWQADKSPDAPGRLENLKELVAAMAEFDSLSGFLDHVSLVMENTAETGSDMISLMTLHGAKGLEFNDVFLPGWEEGLFPHQRAMDEAGLKGLEEERRLAYVGLTRARRRAFVSYAANRRVRGQWQSSLPSRFVGELPEDHIDSVAEPGLYPRAPSLQEPWGAGSSFFGRRAEAPRLVTAERPRPAVGYVAGDRVFHQKFGYGTVRASEGGKLAISFDKAGDKMVMDSFVAKA
jgi:DNA helicase-2/ATP-dependent DNA helicase PcrA